MRRLIAAAVLVALAIALGFAACSGDDGSASNDQRKINSVLVGSFDELAAADSEAVSAIGVELVALGRPLEEYVDGQGDQAVLLRQMTEGVDRIEARLTPDRAPEVLATFEPYVESWRDLLAALDADDQVAYDEAIERLRDLDQIRVDRVVEAYGEQVGRSLVEDD